MRLYAKELTREDIPFVCHVFEQNRAVLHGRHISPEEWRKAIFGKYADPDEVHFVIMSGDAPAAWLKLNGLHAPEIWISMLAVDQAFQGKGVGRFAIKQAEQYAKDCAKSAVRVRTTKDNLVAKTCYLNCGYEIVREMIYQVGDGINREGYEFRKLII